MDRQLPEQEGLYERRRKQAVTRENGQSFADALDSLSAYDRAFAKYALSLPVWVDETIGQYADGTEPFALDFHGIGDAPLV